MEGKVIETNRLIFTDKDESVGLSSRTNIIGYTVVKAPKGVAKPSYIEKGNTQKILNLVGAPSKNYPGIQEAIDFNQQFSLWLSAPPGVLPDFPNYYGILYFTKKGTIEYGSMETDPENPNFSIFNTVGNTNSPYSNGSTKAYALSTLTLDNIPVNKSNMVRLSIKYTLNNVTYNIKLKFNLTEGQVLYDPGNIVVGGITDGTATGTKIIITGSTSVPGLDFSNDSINNYFSNNLSSVSIGYTHIIGENDVIMSLYQTSPRDTKASITVSMIDTRSTINNQDNPNVNTCVISIRELNYGNTYYQSNTIRISPDRNKKDGFGSSLFVEDVLGGNDFIRGKAYAQFTDPRGSYQFPWETNPNTGNITYTINGARAVTSSSFSSANLAPTLQEGWNYASDAEYEDVKIFFDAESVDALKSTFASLRNSTHKFSTFISGIKVSSSSASSAVEDLRTARATLPNVTGLAYYCNEFLVTESYTGTSYWTIPIGAVAAMLAKIMNDRMGGAAPMFVNVNGLGGQISKSVKKAKYTFTAEQLDVLDSIGVNPIILDSYFGLMITSQRTAQSPIMLTDWSFLGHQMAFDLFKYEIRRDVMLPQIGKPINNFYMTLRKDQCQAILNRRIAGLDAIWADGKVYVEEVNTPETRMQNKFVIKIRVKVNPFSEYVELVFNNVGQKSEV